MFTLCRAVRPGLLFPALVFASIVSFAHCANCAQDLEQQDCLPSYGRLYFTYKHEFTVLDVVAKTHGRAVVYCTTYAFIRSYMYSMPVSSPVHSDETRELFGVNQTNK